MIYKIACSWEVFGEMEIEASSFKKAIAKAYNDEEEGLPTETTYVEGSFRVDEETSILLNEMRKIMNRAKRKAK